MSESVERPGQQRNMPFPIETPRSLRPRQGYKLSVNYGLLC
jgi:hypothetical protein